MNPDLIENLIYVQIAEAGDHLLRHEDCLDAAASAAQSIPEGSGATLTAERIRAQLLRADEFVRIINQRDCTEQARILENRGSSPPA